MTPEAARRLLDISATAPLTRDSIESAFRKTVRAKHPDLHPGSKINMATFNTARDALLREVERRQRQEAFALATKIRAESAASKKGMSHVLTHAIEAGQLLKQAKDLLRHTHTEFTPFVRNHCHLPMRTAQHYMELADMWAKVAARDKNAKIAFLTERALRAMVGPARKKDRPDSRSQSHAQEKGKAPSPTEEKATSEERKAPSPTEEKPAAEPRPPEQRTAGSSSALFEQTPRGEPPLDHESGGELGHVPALIDLRDCLLAWRARWPDVPREYVFDRLMTEIERVIEMFADLAPGPPN